jgi:hypothetical protein
MVWNLEDNTDNPEELRIYKYVLKQSKNPKFTKTLMRFLNLYEYLKVNKFKSSSELQQNVLSHGKPLFTDEEAEKIFDMSVMRGGESKYPFLNNAVRQFLGWMYQWSPDVVANFMDGVSDMKERLQIFKHVREDYELGEIYGLVLDSITELIPMNVTVIENIASEIPFVGPIASIIATMISCVLIVFNNMLHFAQGDDGGILVDSFLMIPFIGTSLRSAATAVEKQAKTLSDKRQKLIETVQRSFGDEEAELIAKYIPDLDNLDSYELPSMDVAQQFITQKAQNLAQQHGIPTSIDSAHEMAEQHIQGLAQKHVPGLERLQNVANNINSIQDRIGGNRFTTSRPLKKKWGTRKKSKL